MLFSSMNEDEKWNLVVLKFKEGGFNPDHFLKDQVTLQFNKKKIQADLCESLVKNSDLNDEAPIS